MKKIKKINELKFESKLLLIKNKKNKHDIAKILQYEVKDQWLALFIILKIKY